MTSATALTGRNGKHQVGSALVARAKQWQVSPKLASTSEWSDSDSAGYTNRASGRYDCTFTTEGVYDTSNKVFDLFMPGDIVKSVLWMNATNLYWHFPRALCSDFQLTVNIDSEEIVGHSESFGSDGIFYKPGGSGAPSETLPSS